MSKSVFNARNALFASLALFLAACGAPQGEDAAPKADKQKSEEAASNASSENIPSEAPSIERSVASLFNGAKPRSVTESVIPGLYEVAVAGGVFYTTENGQYFLNGEMIEVEGRRSLTAAARDKARAEMMDLLDPKEAIIFKSKGKPKEVLNVFTDVECGYCRELHKHVQAYNDKGYEIRYFPWPRSGVQGPVFDEMVSVWCASNKQAALTAAKEGRPPPSKTCDNPVTKYFNLGMEFGVNGTPAIYLSTGEQVGGYVPPENIDAEVEKVRAQNQSAAE